MPLTPFHPAVSAWFEKTFTAPTQPQTRAWPAIREGRQVLIAAPTGSGKTLAAFLSAIDSLVRQGVNGGLPDETQVVYVSPLKALSNDIRRNLEWPLAGIRDQLIESGLPDVPIRVLTRTGDTTPTERAAMKKSPPHILVTTPESLYLLLTSESGRAMLATARTMIVDEIHAVAASKRGSHLALSLERLAALVAHPLQRIGLSATQKPIEEIARFLVGNTARAEPVEARAKISVRTSTGSVRTDRSPECVIIDTGHIRDRDLALELPPAPLEAVMSGEVWETLYDRLAALAQEHRTTLVFANTRRMVERVTHHLSTRLGAENVAAHHGSLSKETRLDAEQRLKEGKLRALVATASLELGIDIGEVDLVCQLGTPRAIATFLQRVGRSGHGPGGLPKGRLFPLSRDELVECAALLDAVRRGELDRLIIPDQPLDVLAQQVVAEVSAREWGEDELYKMVRGAWPYRNLARADFDAVVRMLADGYATRRGRRGAYLHRDAVNRRLRARKGARLTALTSGGAIPDNADYAVLLEPTGTFIGTVNEDFAVESMAGDIFQLGNHSYRILRIESGKVRVEDARGAPPSIPFWLGEAPTRTAELSVAVSRLRAEIASLLEHVNETTLVTARERLEHRHALPRAAAEQVVEYLGAAKGALGAIPTQQTIVLERFFDETGGQQLVIHAPFGSRINRAFGLALRKRFCRQFNFELQAAATDDAIVLSLGETHSFPLEEVARYLNPRSVRDVLRQALLTAPLFTARWRWVASIALAVRRYRGGRKNPPQLQRIEAEDLMAVVFPDCLACFENIAGDREIPDHPLVNQTMHDCLTEAMDIEGLERLLAGFEDGTIVMVARDLPHPSPLAQEILNARPYAFLDDAPLEERRTQAVASRRWLDPVAAGELGRLDAGAIARVREEAWPQADSADELHDALMLLGCVTETEGRRSHWEAWFDELVRTRRAARLDADGTSLWVTAEMLPMLRAVYPQARLEPPIEPPAEYAVREWDRQAAHQELLRGRLQGLGPVTATQLASALALPSDAVDAALVALETEGFAMRGQFTPRSDEANGVDHPSPSFPLPEGEGTLSPTPLPQAGEGSFVLSEPRRASRALHNLEWCERRLLARIHRYTLEQLRAEIEPVTAADFLRFLFDWHGITADPKPEGPQALAAVIERLEGFEAATVAWEADLLPARLHDYDPEWLDNLCRAGRTTWLRLTPPKSSATETAASPVRTTPIGLVTRRNLATWREASGVYAVDAGRLSPRAHKAAAFLTAHGASFFEEIAAGSGLLRTETEEALGELVALGLATADSYAGLRALLMPADKRSTRRGRRRLDVGIEEAGRWALIRRSGNTDPSSPEQLETIARTLLRRYGVVFKRMLEREASFLPSWYELLRVYRRLEARGEIRGGRFVAGMAGEQYALLEAVSALRVVRKKPKDDRLVSLSACDPLNLVGILTPGARVPALAGNRVLYRDGVPIAVEIGGETRFLETLAPEAEWQARTALLRQPVPPALRMYM
jgi:ATP-dependent Lhr-like helicase